MLHLAKLDFSLQERKYILLCIGTLTMGSIKYTLILQVLLAFSGGMSSRVLLGLAEEVIYITGWLGLLKVVCYTGTEVDCV